MQLSTAHSVKSMSWWRGMAQKTKWYKIIAYAKATKVQIILVPRFILRFQARCHLGEWLCCQVFEQSSALHPGSAIIFPVKARGAINQPVSMHYSLFPWLFCILFNKSWSEQGQRSGRCYFSGATAARSAVPPPLPFPCKHDLHSPHICTEAGMQTVILTQSVVCLHVLNTLSSGVPTLLVRVLEI